MASATPWMDAFAIASAGLFLTAVISLLTSALYLVALVALGKLARATERTAVAEAALPRVALMLVAHDEERVIEGSVRSLTAQRYPRDRFAVFVVADRSTDDTAARAKNAGATVLARDAGAEGKAAAVAFGAEAILGQGGFDALAIFDADNAVAVDFLEAVGRRLAHGARVVQGFVDAKNPGDSWVSGSSALGFWAIAALTQEPRERLCLSAPLMGTGFAMHAKDAMRFLANAESLTDDLELGARLALDGVRVAYEPSAHVLDEKPGRLGSAVAQRHRWMQGRWAVAGKYLPRLIEHALGGKASPAVRIRALDVSLQLVLPSLPFTAVAILSMAAAGAILGKLLPPVFARTAFALPPRSLFAVGLALYVVPAVGIARFRPPPRVWLYYALQPVYLLLSAPLAMSGFFTRRSRAWKRTPKGLV
jgi:cellulose synthase/poly-beta-1,6-N-acetylglucosamine synthase-like glycosyltransferase